MNEISVRINKLQTEINEANNSNSNDKLKRVQDDIEALEGRINSNEQQTNKLGDDLTVLKS
jgi:chaperonin cofactor prefoldin